MYFSLGRSALALALSLLAVQTLANAADVSVTQPQPVTRGESLRLSGSVVALQRANLSVRTDGLVAKRLVDIGSHVRKGDALLKLDATLADIELTQASAAVRELRARRNEARRLLSEVQRLRENNHVSENEVLMRAAELAISEAQLEAALGRELFAREQVARHVLLAPFDGVISRRETDAGEWVNRGDPVLELVHLDTVRVDVGVPQERFARIDANTPVEVCSDSQTDNCLAGTVAAKVPVSDPTTRAFPVRVEVSAPNSTLLPGTSATVVFRLGDSPDTEYLLPARALLRHPDGSHSVFLVEDGKARRRPVTVLQQTGSDVIVRGELSAGTAVISRGQAALEDGQAVRTQ